MSPRLSIQELIDHPRFIHWLQDVPDQAAIVRQYCRYTGEIKSGRNIKEMVNRALQFALSDPKGPVYLTAAREILEEVCASSLNLRTLFTHVNLSSKLTEDSLKKNISAPSPRAPCRIQVINPLPSHGPYLTSIDVELIATTLMSAKRPLVITGYLGRNLRAPPLLEELCDKLPINVVEMVGSDLCISSSHEAYLGMTVTTHPAVCEADVILILDCDVPWIPTAGKPQRGKRSTKFIKLSTKCFPGTKVFHLDVDPLKQQMPRRW